MAKQNVTLCEVKLERVSIYVDASLVGGELHISGQDIGEAAEEFWGDSDYEYWLTLPAKDTKKFFKLICADSPGKDPLIVLQKSFTGKALLKVSERFAKSTGSQRNFFLIDKSRFGRGMVYNNSR